MGSGSANMIIPGLEAAGGLALTAFGMPEVGVPLMMSGGGNLAGSLIGGPQGGQAGSQLGGLGSGALGYTPSAQTSQLNTGLNQLQQGMVQQRQQAMQNKPQQAPPVPAGNPLPQSQSSFAPQMQPVPNLQQLQLPGMQQPMIGGAPRGQLMNPQGQMNPATLRQIMAMMGGGQFA